MESGSRSKRAFMLIIVLQAYQTTTHCVCLWRKSITAPSRKGLLVKFYVRELLKLMMAMNSNQNKVTLSSLYDKTETQLRALETLGVATDKYAAMLFPLVESCLSEEVLRAWQRSGYVGSVRPSGETRLESLMSFLKKCM
jgi:hypothetical protein